VHALLAVLRVGPLGDLFELLLSAPVLTIRTMFLKPLTTMLSTMASFIAANTGPGMLTEPGVFGFR